MIRITGGELRGRALELPPGLRTRPSSGKLREALFSALADRIHDAVVADLFAGSGALGVEALSRGARHAVFVELDSRCIRVLHQNLAHLGLGSDRARVRRADARRWLQRLEEGGLPEPERASVLLLDPPYLPGEAGRLLPQLAALVESGAVAVCVLEHASEDAPQPSITHGLRAIVRHHGRGAFTLLEKESP